MSLHQQKMAGKFAGKPGYTHVNTVNNKSTISIYNWHNYKLFFSASLKTQAGFRGAIEVIT